MFDGTELDLQERLQNAIPDRSTRSREMDHATLGQVLDRRDRAYGDTVLSLAAPRGQQGSQITVWETVSGSLLVARYNLPDVW